MILSAEQKILNYPLNHPKNHNHESHHLIFLNLFVCCIFNQLHSNTS